MNNKVAVQGLRRAFGTISGTEGAKMSCFQKQFTLIPFHCVRGDSYASCAALTNRKSAWLGSAICSANGSGPACNSGRSLSGGLRSPPCSEGLALTWVVMMDPQSAVDQYSIPYCAGCRRFRVGQRRFRRKTINDCQRQEQTTVSRHQRLSARRGHHAGVRSCNPALRYCKT